MRAAAPAAPGPWRRALGAEVLKLRTTRTTWALVAATVGLIVLIVTAATVAGDWDGEASTTAGVDIISIAGIAQLFALVFGILAVTAELRHGTMTPSLLAVPNRLRLLGAKLGVNLAAGALLGVVTVGAAVGAAAVVFAIRGLDADLLAGDAGRVAAGTVAAVALYAAVGVAVGAIVRNQVGALVGALGYLFMIEPLLTLLPGFDEPLERYGLSAVGDALSGSTLGGETISQLHGGLLFVGYVAILLAAGAFLLRRRDVTG